MVGISNSRIVDLAVKLSSDVEFEASKELEKDSMLGVLTFKGSWNIDRVLLEPLILVARISVSWVIDSVVTKLFIDESKLILSVVI